ncbi:MAG: GspE/PulE family protein [Verrucomicrobiota bacterium]|jgi:type II secretory ATPase GspE/PulE/Tfp pilus assembly ATPase PilB-like protein|nr:GspE/PulE family protein [Verrucomicrobiota bacterium]
MAYTSFKDFCVATQLAKENQFDEWQSDWRRECAESNLGESLPEFLRKRSGKSEADFLNLVSKAFKDEKKKDKEDDTGKYNDWQRVQLSGVEPTKQALGRVTSKVASQHRVVPLIVDDGVLVVAVSNPFNTDLLNAVRFAAHGPIKFVLASSDEVEKLYEKYYGVGAETIDELAEDQEEDEDDLELMFSDDKEIAEGDQEASIIKFVNQVIWLAHKNRATDIHFEPHEDELQIRHRIDGILHRMPLPSSLQKLQAALISRIKVMSGMNIAEKRMPQDGRINVRIKGEEIDIRVSTVPTVYGESVSLRLLTRDSVLKGLDTLGMTEQIAEPIKDIITKPHGIVLVTGPTGSGKSTSLYAFLNTINSEDKRIMTVEDPVEYEMKGVNQVHVKNDIGRTFSHVLRHFLRQDPDVIMVGEIRDGDTAEIAIQAANTGHLVFSTLHTNDAPSAFTRLIDMGTEPFLVADAIEAIMAQRLVRTVCPECKTEQEVSKDYLLKVDFPPTQISTAKFWHGAGCDACGERGYQGRTGIYELLQNSEAIQQLVIDEAAATVIGKQARNEGMLTLRDYGWGRALTGDTTIEEVLRVTQAAEDPKVDPKENL